GNRAESRRASQAPARARRHGPAAAPPSFPPARRRRCSTLPGACRWSWPGPFVEMQWECVRLPLQPQNAILILARAPEGATGSLATRSPSPGVRRDRGAQRVGRPLKVLLFFPLRHAVIVVQSELRALLRLPFRMLLMRRDAVSGILFVINRSDMRRVSIKIGSSDSKLFFVRIDPFPQLLTRSRSLCT